MFREERIGPHRLILGDALEVMPTLGKVDAVVTSPPYGQQRDYGAKITDWRGLVCGALLKTPAHETTQILCNLGLIHRDGAVVPYWDDLFSDMTADGWRLFGWYVWDQLHGQTGDWQGRLAPAFEFVFHFNKAARRPNKTKPTLGGKIHGPGLRTQSGQRKKTQDGKPVNATKIPDAIIRCARETSPQYSEHPARFPVRFAHELIEPYSAIGETILDPFMGSGTTLVACQKLGRAGIGIEIDPDYFQIACKRVDEAMRQPDLFVQPAPQPIQEGLDLG
jgi:DNA modification methylase